MSQIKYPKIPLAQSLIAICKAKGLKHIVISPGSRNAPLTIGFASNPFFTCYSIADERCAAFFALGIAQQLEEPVAVVCTSGSAVLNYYPAVAEAFYSQIPLVIISADRPHDKIDIGDGQTIRQENVFSNHIITSANLTEEVSTENDLAIQNALHLAVIEKGPVHINIPFEEPLYETVDALTVETKWISFDSENSPTFELDSLFINQWKTSKKKLIVIGENKPDVIQNEILEQLAADSSVVVMTEKTSNLYHTKFVHNIDTIITPFTDVDFAFFQPDILITFGGMVVSKRIKAFLRKYKPVAHWHIDERRAYNTYGCLTEHFKTKPQHFFEELLKNFTETKSEYDLKMQEIISLRKVRTAEYLKNIPFSDFKVFDFISKNLPPNIQLQISNSSAVRYLQLVNIEPSITVFCNRGTSGIDGSTSTAIGAAIVQDKPTFFITGDISFFYDSNALWNNYIPKNFKIILINNGGGGIFRILPGHEENNVFTTFFETSHRLNAKYLAAMFHFNYHWVDNEADLEETWSLFITSNEQPCLLEINTPEKLNNKILLDYFKNLK